MTRDDLIATLRALGVTRIPDPLPPFRPRCACGRHRGTRGELPAGHDWHQAHGGPGCTADDALELRCTCGRGFGMNVDALRAHTKHDHGREASTDERTPK